MPFKSGYRPLGFNVRNGEGWGINSKGSCLKPGSVAGIKCQANVERLLVTKSRTGQDAKGTQSLSAATVPDTFPRYVAVAYLSNDLPEHRTNADPDSEMDEFYYIMGSDLRMRLNLDLV